MTNNKKRALIRITQLAMAALSVSILCRVSSDLSAFVDTRDIPEDTLDSFIVSLEFVYREVVNCLWTDNFIVN